MTDEPAVIGLDLSIKRTGVALPDRTTLNVTTSETGYRRHADIAIQVAKIVRHHRPRLVALEDYAPNSIGRLSTIRAGELGGIIRTQLELARVPWIAVGPTELKKYATGRGNATKPEMVKAAIELGARRDITHDEADAYLLRRYGIRHIDLTT